MGTELGFQTGWHRARTWQCTWLCTSCPVSLCPLCPCRPLGPWPCTPGRLYRETHYNLSGTSARSTSTLALALAEDIGVIHQHRCCSPAAGTDMASVQRPKHWKQIRSMHPDGRPSSSIPGQNSRGPFCRSDAVNTPSVPYPATVPTIPVFSARASTKYPHHTPHAPSPPLVKLPSTVTSAALPAPSHVLRTLHHAPGPGVEVGWARLHNVEPRYRPHHSIVLHLYVHVLYRTAPPQVPTFRI